VKYINHSFLNLFHLQFSSLILIASILLWSGTKIDAQNAPFITTWKTDNPGSSNNTSITIPTDPGYSYSYDVDWNNDGTYDDLGVTGDITHDYEAAGTYSVAIRGNFPAIYFNNSGDKDKIISIDQWGDIQWESMFNAFSGCINLTSDATDTPNLSLVTNCVRMFSEAVLFNGNISNWDVSNLTNCLQMFNGATSFNQDIGDWDVSNITNMGRMFEGATSFNQDIGDWDVSNVIYMAVMFSNASSFNQDISRWDISSAGSLSYMFAGATSFNQDVSSWDVSNVIDLSGMFENASSFNTDIDIWDISSVVNMRFMFAGATSFNQDISSWDVSKVTDMASMFARASSFNQDISGWNMSSVTIIRRMFYDASSFNQDISNWNVSKVENMLSAFRNAASFNQDLGSWNISKVTDMTAMMNNSGLSSTNYDATLTGWSQNPNTPDSISLGAVNLSYCMSEDDRNNLINNKNWTITGDTKNCSSSSNPFITTWNTEIPDETNNSSIEIPTAPGGYNYDIDWDNDGMYDTLGVTGSITHDFGSPGIYTIRLRGTFPRIRFNPQYDDNLKLISIDQWGDIEWSSFSEAFEGCRNLIYNATDTPDLSQVSSMYRMFFNCTAFDANLNGWDVSKVVNMEDMFRNCESFSGRVANWNVSSVQNMKNMFYECDNFNGDLSNWDVSGVTNMRAMFFNCPEFNSDISSWDVSKVQYMRDMLANCIHFDQNLGDWELTNIIDMVDFINNTGLSVNNYDNTLIAWNNQGLSNLQLGDAFGLLYCNGKNARSNLLDNGWEISGDAPYCGPESSFITTWNTEIADETNNSSIEIPTAPGGYNFDIDWDNDGQYDTLRVTGGITHDFGSPGIYTIRIRGTFPRIQFIPQYDDNLKLISIDQWGDIEWSSFSEAFEGCSNLIYNATDTPDLSQVSSMYRMFFNCTSLDADLNDWDVSKVINMEDMFRNCESLTGGVSNWDVSSVQNMENMFREATNFNVSLSQWNLNSLTRAERMLDNCGLDIQNYDATLRGWSNNTNTPENITLGANGLFYCNSEADRKNLIDNNAWVFAGDEKDCTSSIQNESSLIISVSPNPVRNLLYINAKNRIQYKIKLMNQFGQLLKTGENISHIDMSSYPAGIYYLKLQPIHGAHDLKGKSISFIKTN